MFQELFDSFKFLEYIYLKNVSIILKQKNINFKIFLILKSSAATLFTRVFLFGVFEFIRYFDWNKSSLLGLLHFFGFVTDWSSTDPLEGFFDSCCLLRTGIEVNHIGVLGHKGLNHLVSHLPLWFSVDFVPEDNKGEFFRFLGCTLIDKFIFPGV